MAYSAYYSGLSRISETSKVPVFASIETIVAALIGYIAFGQSIGPGKIVGIALVLISIMVMNRNKSSEITDSDNENGRNDAVNDAVSDAAEE